MMEHDFLKQFWKRMKSVGMYALLFQNSFQKTTWKQYGFLKMDEQINMIFAVLLYIMEQSLKDEPCTMDDIGAYLDSVNQKYLQKPLSYEECKELGEFLINVVLCNEGRAMYFDGYDFEMNAYKIMHISFVANRIVYVDSDVKRTSYYLTDDGYNLILSTLEVENNMKLTIHEIIFQMHLEKASYDKAVDEIKNIFNLLRIQLQKIEETMNRIRRNALEYTVADYREILEGNLETIADTKQKFQNYREVVRKRERELEEEHINVKRLGKQDEQSLENLRIIEGYLDRSIDEYQKILSSHFDLKALYTRELEQISQMALIRRFHLRNDLYDKILDDVTALDRLEYFLRPLFNREQDKIYNINKALEFQKPVREKKEEAESIYSFEEEVLDSEEEYRRERLKMYEASLKVLLGFLKREGEISLKAIRETLGDQSKELVPDTDIFKEIMVELLKSGRLDVQMLKKERSESLGDKSAEFRLSEMFLDLLEQDDSLADVTALEAYRIEDGETIVFEGVKNAEGRLCNIRCSNVLLRLLGHRV